MRLQLLGCQGCQVHHHVVPPHAELARQEVDVEPAGAACEIGCMRVGPLLVLWLRQCDLTAAGQLLPRH